MTAVRYRFRTSHPTRPLGGLVDFSKLKTSDWVVGGSAIVLFIGSFLDWFTLDVSGFGITVGGNGWDTGFFWAGIPVILGLAMLAVVAIRAFSPDTDLPDLPVGWGQAMLIAGCIAGVIVVLKLLIGHDVAGVDLDRSFGLFLSALAAVGLAVGGWMKFQEEKAGGTATGGAAPPPPPSAI
jgi:hypothetical protein